LPEAHVATGEMMLELVLDLHGKTVLQIINQE
jgi:hypothetical protein